MKRVVALTAALALGLAGCSTGGEDTTEQDFLAAHNLEGMDAKEIVDHLDRVPLSERPDDLMASVGTNELALSSDSEEVTLALPEDMNYVSIAPYVDQTHDCFYHSLTTCVGELGNEDIHVTITDAATGEVLVDEQATTFDNGFIGYWLPEGRTGTIETTYQGRTGTTEFSTTEEGATCVTDLQMA